MHNFKPLIVTISVFLILLQGCGGGSSSQNTTPPVTTINSPPSVNAGENIVATEYKQVTIEAAASDADGSIVSYMWEQIEGIDIELQGHDSSTLSFTAPHTLEVEYILLRVTVTDNSGSSSQDEISIEIRPKYGSKLGSSIASIKIIGMDYKSNTDIQGTTKAPYGNYLRREGEKTIFSIGSIEFLPIPSTPDSSIFQILRTYNDKSNEVINFTKLLLTLNEKPENNNVITLSETSKQAVANAGIVLSDLYLPPEEFETSEKINKLIELLVNKPLVSTEDALAYFYDNHIDPFRYTQWFDLAGFFPHLTGLSPNFDDFDNDGVPNATDDFPWDANEWEDSNGDRIGDNNNVLYTFIDTPSVTDLKYSIEKGLFFVTSKRQRSLSIFEISSGGKIKTFNFEDFPEKIAVSNDGKSIYVALLDHFENHTYFSLDDQQSRIAVIDLDSLEIKKTLDVNVHPKDMVSTSSGNLIISPYAINIESDYEIRLYDGETGELKSSDNVNSSIGPISLSPDESWFILNGGNSCHKFSLNNENVTLNKKCTGVDDFLFGPGFETWITPNADKVIFHYGWALSATELNAFSQVFPDQNFYSTVYFDQNNNLVITKGTGSIFYINVFNNEVVKSLTLNRFSYHVAANYIVDEIFLFNDNLYYLTVNRDGSLMHVRVKAH
ncbi:hypothetical protein QX776_04210 [Alteromonadaceae bacterium BrNp21-10]|nr:hypothetical protein [Alteromonadaceae bacterium BrNp21-10]